MGVDDRKPTFAERDRRRREGAGSGSARSTREEARASKAALAAADALFNDEPGGREGRAAAQAVRDAHGTSGLAEACQRFVETVGVPQGLDLISIFLDAGEKSLTVGVLDELLRQRESGDLALRGGLKRQIRLLAEDFDDDLASRAEDLLA